MTRSSALATWLGLALTLSVLGDDATPIKLADCPPAVKKMLEVETRGGRLDSIEKIVEDGRTSYDASATLGGRKYRIYVDAEGMLTEMGLEVGEEEVKFSACPAAVQATFKREARDAKFDAVARDLKYGVPVFEAIVSLGGKEYSIVVAENGTLVEKMLIVAEDEIELTHCPNAVQHAFKEQAQGGKIGPITRATGIGGHVFEAEIEIKGRSYFVELTEGGGLITKSLQDQDEPAPPKP